MLVKLATSIFAFGSAFYLSQKLGVWFDPEDTDSKGSAIEASSPPVETKNKEKEIFFDKEDKRKLERAKENFQDRFCGDHGLCKPPPPKPFTEIITDALYDTWLIVKKIPSCWTRTVDAISRWFRGD